jgi:hypothetical protein
LDPVTLIEVVLEQRSRPPGIVIAELLRIQIDNLIE